MYVVGEPRVHLRAQMCVRALHSRARPRVAANPARIDISPTCLGTTKNTGIRGVWVDPLVRVASKFESGAGGRVNFIIFFILLVFKLSFAYLSQKAK